MEKHLSTFLLSIITAVALWVGASISTLKDSTAELNKNVAVVIEKVSAHEKRISKLEDEKPSSIITKGI